MKRYESSETLNPQAFFNRLFDKVLKECEEDYESKKLKKLKIEIYQLKEKTEKNA